MDNEIIEKTSKAIVEKEILSVPDCLSPYVNSNDKTPAWDGNIYVYRNIHHTMENFEGKIDVQIKGHKVEKISKGNIKFSMPVDTLKAYTKSISGTLLIVVEFIDLEHYQLYYANLLPVDLIELFKTVKKGQKTKTLNLKPIVRKSASSLKFICLNFLENSKKQPNRRFIDVSEMENLEEIKFQVISTEEYLEDYLKNNSIYSYGILKDTKEIVNLPLLKDINIFSTLKYTVILDNEEIDFTFTITSSSTDEKIIIGKSISLEKNTNRFNIKLCGNLYQRINDLKLLMFILKNKKIVTKQGIINLALTKKDEIDICYKTFNAILKKYLEIKNMFDYFDVSFLTDLDELTEKDINNINSLVNLLKGLKLETLKEYKIYNVAINKYNILILPKINCGQIIGLYNLFEDLSEEKFFLKKENGEFVETSIYYMLSCENIKNASNFNSASILKDICNNKIKKETSADCNQLVLNLIRAYDDTNREEFLQLAEDILNEVLKFENIDINVLNLYQIKYRKRELKKQDKINLKNIYERGDNFIKCGAAILLKNKTDYELAYDNLTKAERETIDTSPIIKIIKENSDN